MGIFPFNKSKPLAKFVLKLIENDIRKSLKMVLTNLKGEFTLEAFKNYGGKFGIKRELTTPHLLQQNGVVECRNYIVIKMAQCMIKGRNLPNTFWVEVFNIVIHILNYYYTKIINGMTPQ